MLLASLGAVAVLVLPAVGRAAAAGDPSCSLYAATTGSVSGKGTVTSPFATPQQLVDALRPGQTGCLRGGSYTVDGIRLAHGGTPTAPLTLMSFPGEHATVRVRSEVYVLKGSDYGIFRNLTITGDTASATLATDMIQDLASHTTWEGNDISAGSRVTCMIIGLQQAPWTAQAVGTVIDGNRIHDCGARAAGNQQHAIYVANARATQITNNIIWNASAYGVHLYPDADGVTIAHNVIDGSGWAGVVWASDDNDAALRDDDDVAFANIITGGQQWGLDARWTTGQGTGNAAHDNCLWGNARGATNGALAGVALAGNVTADPGYLDAANHDYRLGPASPCLAVVGYDTAARLQAAAAAAAPPPAEPGPGTGAPTAPPGAAPPGASAGSHAPVVPRGLRVTVSAVAGRTSIVLRGAVAPARDGWWIVARRATRSGWATAGRTRLTAGAQGSSSYRLVLPRGRRAMRVRLTVTRPGSRLAFGRSRVLALASGPV